jgi:hypothetical protein
MSGRCRELWWILFPGRAGQFGFEIERLLLKSPVANRENFDHRDIRVAGAVDGDSRHPEWGDFAEF